MIFQIILLLSISLLLRLYALGSIPYGISVAEARHIFIFREILRPLIYLDISFEARLALIRLLVPLLSSLTPLIVYLIWLRMKKEDSHLTGFLWGLFVALNPWHIYFSRRFLSAPIILTVLLVFVFCFLEKISKIRKEFWPVLAFLPSGIIVLLELLFLSNSKVFLEPIWVKNKNFLEILFIWFKNISSYFDLGRLGFEDEVYILGIKENSPLLSITIPFVIGGFLFLLKNSKNFFWFLLTIFAPVSVFSLFYPSFNLSLAYILIIPYCLLAAISLKELLNFLAFKKAKIITLILISSFGYNIARSWYLFYYYQPSFDKSERISAYKNLAEYLSSLDFNTQEIIIAQNVEGGKQALFSYWFLQGDLEEKFKKNINFNDCKFESLEMKKKFICVFAEKKETGSDFILLETIPNLKGDPIFWVGQKTQSES